MIELEDQLSSLEPSRKLKVLGVKQDSLNFWQWHCVSGKYFLTNNQDSNGLFYRQRL